VSGGQPTHLLQLSFLADEEHYHAALFRRKQKAASTLSKIKRFSALLKTLLLLPMGESPFINRFCVPRKYKSQRSFVVSGITKTFAFDQN